MCTKETSTFAPRKFGGYVLPCSTTDECVAFRKEHSCPISDYMTGSEGQFNGGRTNTESVYKSG